MKQQSCEIEGTSPTVPWLTVLSQLWHIINVSSVFVAKHMHPDFSNHRLSLVGTFVTNHLSPHDRTGKANSGPGRGTLPRRTSVLLIHVTNSVINILALHARNPSDAK